MLTSLRPRDHTRLSSLGILGDILEPLCEWLHSQGYPANAIRRRMTGAVLLERLLAQQHIHSLEDCSAVHLSTSVPQPRRWTAHMAHALSRSLGQYLAECGSLVQPAPTPTESLLEMYQRHVEEVRGLSPTTVTRHVVYAREFLDFLNFDHQQHQLDDLCPPDIDAFLTKAGRHRGRDCMQKMGAILRSFLRFLTTKELVAPGLDAHVELPRLYRGEHLPRALPWKAVLSLLHAIDQSTPKGRRDYAIFMLIATYGLRIGEVALLSLDNIVWRERYIRISRPKTGVDIEFPLTDEVATALIAYLRQDRPASIHRKVFLCMRAPWLPIKSTGITDAFDVWAGQAKIELPRPGGPHCLRHSVAMKLLHQNTSLKTIGDLLGHRSIESTAVYLRLGLEDLRDVALPLPDAGRKEISS